MISEKEKSILEIMNNNSLKNSENKKLDEFALRCYL